MDSVKLIEGINSWQGEGPDVGQRMLLLRFKYCNLSCSWCDTSVKMHALQEAIYTTNNIQKIIDEEKCGIMITGGEPTHKPHIEETVMLLSMLRYPIANIETNGYQLPELLEKMKIRSMQNIKYIYSPKLYTFQDAPPVVRTTEKVMTSKNVYIKYVVGKEELESKPVHEYLKLLTHYRDRVYLMPKGETKEEILNSAPAVFDLAEKYKLNVTTRMHIIYSFV